jgi:hypothetical protein
MAAPRVLEFSSSPCRFCDDVVSPWVTEHWANHGATREHYQPLTYVFSTSCPTTTESTELDWNTCILELPYSRKQNNSPCSYAALLTQWLFCLIICLHCLQISMWHVINAKICKKQVGLKTGGARLLDLPRNTHSCNHCQRWLQHVSTQGCKYLCKQDMHFIFNKFAKMSKNIISLCH